MSCARQGTAESLLRGLLVVQAAELPKGSMERLLLVAAFAQIGYSAGLRPYKCFNPVMGETFEVRPHRSHFFPVHSSTLLLGFCERRCLDTRLSSKTPSREGGEMFREEVPNAPL